MHRVETPKDSHSKVLVHLLGQSAQHLVEKLDYYLDCLLDPEQVMSCLVLKDEMVVRLQHNEEMRFQCILNAVVEYRQKEDDHYK